MSMSMNCSCESDYHMQGRPLPRSLCDVHIPVLCIVPWSLPLLVLIHFYQSGNAEVLDSLFFCYLSLQICKCFANL